MCTSCQLPKLDESATDQFAERLLDVLNHGALATMISIGHRTSLFDTMKSLPPSTSHEIAEAASLDERYVREWLGAMVTGSIVDYDPSSDCYELPAAHAACLTREAAPNNMAAFAQYIPLFGTVEDGIISCFEEGGGLPYSAFPRFQTVMAEDSGQSVLPALVEHILPLVPGIVGKLRDGIDVLDVGFGRGKALNLMAKTFPNSRFTGYEISAEGVRFAQAEAEATGLTNVRFEIKDAAEFDDCEAFDLICTFDSVHDQADPDALLRNIRRALRPDGVYLMQDIDASSNVGGNVDHPMGTLLYTISCMHCMTVSLAEDGQGLGAMWGVEVAEERLQGAGFSSTEIHRLPHDIQNAYFINRKQCA
ncbi:MAG: class I SAM-dependent methyltransferase [Verrucomicrobiales bacterium]